MASFTQLYLHTVWATWNRRPFIFPSVELPLYAALAAKCISFRCEVLAIGGVVDHVHMLIDFTPTVTLAQLIGEIKGASSHAMTHSIAPGLWFKWQSGYSAFTVDARSVPSVRSYILNQKTHHANAMADSDLEQPTPLNS